MMKRHFQSDDATRPTSVEGVEEMIKRFEEAFRESPESVHGEAARSFRTATVRAPRVHVA
jgi:hypothetical protein